MVILTQGPSRCMVCLDTCTFTTENEREEHKETPRHLLNYCLYQLKCNKKKTRNNYFANNEDVDVHINSSHEIKRTRTKKLNFCTTNTSTPEIIFEFQVTNKKIPTGNDMNDCIVVRRIVPLVRSEVFSMEAFTLLPRIHPKKTFSVSMKFKNPGEISTYMNTFLFEYTAKKGDKLGNFLMLRGLEIRVEENQELAVQIENQNEEESSPYMGESWHDVKMTVSGSREGGSSLKSFKDCAIPKGMKELVRRNLRCTPDIEMSPDTAKLFMKIQSVISIDTPTEIQYAKPKNYNSYFKYLLFIEEQEGKEQMAKYNMKDVTMSLVNENQVELIVPGLAEKRPSLLEGDIVFARFTLQPDVQYEGEILQVKENTVIIRGFDKYVINTLEKNSSVLLDVRFVFCRYSFYVQHKTLEDLNDSHGKYVMKLLFPKITNCTPSRNFLYRVPDVKFKDSSIEKNQQQRQAILNIIRGTSFPAPYIIFGPPGTGKTVTFVEAILQVKDIIKNSSILVCAQSNSACDLLASKLFSSGHCEEKDILRLYSSSRKKDTGVPKDIAAICSDRIRPCKILVCTLITAAKLVKTRYTHVFIDEIGQAAESEALVAIHKIKAETGLLVIAGDHKQLGPVIQGKLAAERGLEVSLLDRLMNTIDVYQYRGEENGYNELFVTQLVDNFRSHGSILQLPNTLFYRNGLIARAPKDSVSDLSLQGKKKMGPISFHGVIGRERREGRTPSIFNPMEIRVVLEYIDKLLQSKVDPPVKATDIGVIAPYKRQVQKIRQCLSNRAEWKEIEVGTTEEFQGREKRIIIVSCVRSQVNMMDYDKKFKLGFLRNPRRFNVLMTRAKAKLIVVGNPSLLTLDAPWHSYIMAARDDGSYFGCPMQMRDANFVKEVSANIKLLGMEK